MFNKMIKVFKEKLDNGNGGYEWNCDAIDFYNAMYELAVSGIITSEQWNVVMKIVAMVK